MDIASMGPMVPTEGAQALEDEMVALIAESNQLAARIHPILLASIGANTAAIESHNAGTKAGIEMRQIKYLNNIVEQDHRAIKRQTRPMLGFKSFWSAGVTLAGIEIMHMIRKGQLALTGELCPARQF
jgi:transposase-like protein